MTNAVATAAERLRVAETKAQPCAPVRDVLGACNVADAYAVQDTNVRLAEAAGRRIVGRKIGLTAKAIQAQLGVDQPDYGVLFADMAVPDGERVPAGAILQPRVEAEVALVLGADLTQKDLTVAELIRATAYVLPAIEILGSRIASWDINIVDTIADNASSGAFVLGAHPRKLEAVDLRLCGMALFKGSETVSVGAGAACLGHPLNSATWLARKMVGMGRPLCAGDIVLTGALGPMVSVSPGSVYEARIQGLGTVRAAFAQTAHV